MLQADAKRDEVKSHKFAIAINFNAEDDGALKTLRINRSRP